MDEYMNLVIDDASELSIKKQTKKTLGTDDLKSFHLSSTFFGRLAEHDTNKSLGNCFY